MLNSWVCEYCGTVFVAKSLCSDHETCCDNNPKNKTCNTCKNWYFDPSAGIIYGEDSEPEGEPKCRIPGYEPFQRNCDQWKS